MTIKPLNQIVSITFSPIRQVSGLALWNWRLSIGTRVLEPLILIGILTVLFTWVYRDMFQGRPLLIGDLTPFFPYPPDAWRLFTNAWSDTNLGWENPFLATHTIIQLVTGFLVGESSAAQRLFYLPLMPLSVLSMYFLLRYLVHSSSTRILIALAYGINGASITWFSVGAFPFLSIQITSPLLILFFIKYLRDEHHQVRNLLIITVILAFETGIQPYVLPRMFPLLSLVWLLETIRRRSWRFAVASLVGIGAAGLLYFILTGPFSFGALQDVVSSVTGSSGGIIGSAAGRDIAETITVLEQNYNTPYVLETLRYLLYLMVGVALLSYALGTPENRWRYLGFSFLAIMLVGAMFSISTGKSLVVFEKLPFLLIFKEPQKLQTIILQGTYIAIALLMDDLSRRRFTFQFRRLALPLPWVHGWLGLIVLVGGLFFILTEAHPPYDREVANLQRFLTTGFDTSAQATYQVPRAFDDAAAWIRERREQGGFFRTIWLPSGRTVNRNILPIYDPPSFRKPNDPMLTRLILEPLYANKTRNLGERLGPFSVKYIIVPNPEWEWTRWQKDTEGSPRYILAAEQGVVSVGDPAEYLKVLLQQKDLALVYSGETFSAFENLEFIPHFSAYTKTFVVAPFNLVETQLGDRAAFGESIIRNGDFTEGLTGWKTDTVNGAEYAVEPLGEGRSSLRITVPGKPLYGAVIQTLAARDDLSYRLTVRARSDNAVRASLRIYYRDDGGKPIKYNDAPFERIWFPVEPEAKDSEFFLGPPSGTRSIRIHVEATHSAVPDISANTWFEEVTLSRVSGGVLPPLLNREFIGVASENMVGFSPSVLNVPKLLESLPYADQDKTLVLIGSLQKAAPSDMLNIADAVVFLGNPKLSAEASDWIADARAVMMVYEAEAVVNLIPLGTTGQQDSEAEVLVGASEDFSYSRAQILKGQWLPYFEITAPRPGFYRVLVRGELVRPRITLNGVESEALPMDAGTDGLRWFQSGPTFLEEGHYSVFLQYEGLNAIIDQLVVLQTRDSETDAEDILRPAPLELDITPINTGEFNVSVRTEDSFTLLFREAYDEGWTAVSAEGNLDHLPTGPLGWANGFRSNNGGNQEITVKFDGQDRRQLIIGVWAAGWAVVAVVLLLLIFPKRLRPNGGRMVRVLAGLATGAWRRRPRTTHLNVGGIRRRQ